MLLRRLAVGGMAEVYVAKAKGVGGFEKLVAIKVIHPRYVEDDHFVQLLVEEAKISVLLSHINVVQIFDLGHVDDTYFIVMEYIEGADAQRIIRLSQKRKTAIPIELGVHIMAEVCRGLDYAHTKKDQQGRSLGIVHRDISPHNVLVSRAGEVKLVDFGIAKAALRSEQTEVGVIKGKYCYMSPEQAWGKKLDARSDVFSAGVVLHELITGQSIHQKDSIPVMLDRVRKAEIPRPSSIRKEVPEELDAILMKAVSRKPADRYESAIEFGRALTNYLRSSAPSFSAASVAEFMGELLVDTPPITVDSFPSQAAEAPSHQPLAEPVARSAHRGTVRTQVSTPPPTSGRVTSNFPVDPNLSMIFGRPRQSIPPSTPPPPVLALSSATELDTSPELFPEDAEPTETTDSLSAMGFSSADSFSYPEIDSFEDTYKEIRNIKGGLSQVKTAARNVLGKRTLLVLGFGLVGLGALAVNMASSTPPTPTLEIVSVPPGARVELDGRSMRGKTPMRIDEGLRPNATHRVELALEGYEPWEASFQPSESVVTQVAVLQPIRASLTVETEPPAARVWINGAFFGISPVQVPGLKAGQKLQIRVSKPRYLDSFEVVRIKSGELQKSVSLELKRRRGRRR